MQDIPSFESLPLDKRRIADLRSDHAGETGAVAIYSGILAITRDPAVIRFAREHRETEIRHRRFFDVWLPREHQSRLLPLWRAAGWLLGVTGALFGSRSVFRTIAAVESFVEGHYDEQIKDMQSEPALRELVATLQSFCDEEVEHRDDAAGRVESAPGIVGRLWEKIVGSGSALGVALARRV